MATDFEDDFEDDFGMEEFGDFGMEPEPPANAREAITQSASNAMTGFKDELMNTDVSEIIKTLSQAVIPKSFGYEADSAIDAIKELSSDTTESFKEVKDATRDIANMTAGMLPDNDFKDSVLNRIQSLFGDKEEGYGNSGPSKEEQLQAESLAMITETLGEMNDKETTESNIKAVLQNNLSKTQNQLLASIATNVSSQFSYTKEMTDKYYRKSLELKYKHLYVAREQSVILSGGFDTFKTQLQEIVHNTALPDVVKATKSEEIKADLRRNFVSSLFSGKDNWINVAKKNLGDKVKGVTAAIIAGKDGLETASGMSDSMAMMGGVGGMAGGSLGGVIKSKLAGKLNDILMKTESGMKFSSTLTEFNASPDSFLFDKAANSEGLKSSLFNFLGDLFTNNDYSNTKSITTRGVDDLSIFDGRIYNSISRVIPDLLSKILLQTEKLNGDNGTSELKFDHQAGEFTTLKNTYKDFKNKTKFDLVNNGVTRNIRAFISDVEEESKTKLTQSEKGTISKRLVSWVSTGNPIAPKLLKEKGFYDKLGKELGPKFSDMVDMYLDADSSEELIRRNKNIVDTLNRVKTSLKNPEELINEYKEQGRIKELTKRGIVTKDEHSGGFSMDMEKYGNFVGRMTADTMDDEYFESASAEIYKNRDKDAEFDGTVEEVEKLKRYLKRAKKKTKIKATRTFRKAKNKLTDLDSEYEISSKSKDALNSLHKAPTVNSVRNYNPDFSNTTFKEHINITDMFSHNKNKVSKVLQDKLNNLTVSDKLRTIIGDEKSNQIETFLKSEDTTFKDFKVLLKELKIPKKVIKELLKEKKDSIKDSLTKDSLKESFNTVKTKVAMTTDKILQSDTVKDILNSEQINNIKEMVSDKGVSKEDFVNTLKDLKVPKETITTLVKEKGKFFKDSLTKENIQETLRTVKKATTDTYDNFNFKDVKDSGTAIFESYINSDYIKTAPISNVIQAGKELGLNKKELKRLRVYLRVKKKRFDKEVDKLKETDQYKYVKDVKDTLQEQVSTGVESNINTKNVQANLETLSNTIKDTIEDINTNPGEKLQSIKKTLLNLGEKVGISKKDTETLTKVKINDKDTNEVILTNLVEATNSLIEKVKEPPKKEKKKRKGNWEDRLTALTPKDRVDLEKDKPLKKKKSGILGMLSMMFPVIFGIGKALTFGGGLIGKILKANMTVGSFLLGKKSPLRLMGKFAFKALGFMGKAGMALLSIPGLMGKMISSVGKVSGSILSGLKGLFTGKFFSNLLKGTALASVGGGAVSYVKEKGSKALNYLSDGFDYLKSKINGGIDSTKKFFKNIWEEGAKRASMMWDYSKGKVSKAVDFIVGGLAGKLQYFTNKAGKTMALATLVGGTAVDYAKKHTSSVLKWVIKGGKKIPLLGIPLVVGTALYYAYQGEYLRAGGELALGIVAQVPVIGTAVSIAGSVALDSQFDKAEKLAKEDPIEGVKKHLSNKVFTPSYGVSSKGVVDINDSSVKHLDGGSYKPGKPVTNYNELAEYMRAEEKFTPKAFWDFKQWTNGYGTKARHKTEVIDTKEAMKRFKDGLRWRYNKVKRFAKGLPESVVLALTDLTYNSGGGWMNSGLGKLVKAKDTEGIKKKLMEYTKVTVKDKNGKPYKKTLQGLVKRRYDEVSWIENKSTASKQKTNINLPTASVTANQVHTKQTTSKVSLPNKITPPNAPLEKVVAVKTANKKEMEQTLKSNSDDILLSMDNTLKKNLTVNKDILTAILKLELSPVINVKQQETPTNRTKEFTMQTKIDLSKRKY